MSLTLAMPAPASEARAILATGSKSFGFAAHFLSPQQWDDAARVYAFCREVDDIADDEAVLSESRRQALAHLRLQVRREVAPSAAVAGLLEVDRRCGLPMDAAVELIDGCESDLGVVRMADDRQLIRYCYRVASTVGLMMCSVLGVKDEHARAFAIDLGVAMQLTNICRDVLEDAESGRVYLPTSRLLAAGVTPDELARGDVDRAPVHRVVRDMLDLADRYYASALHGMRFLPARARLAILVASRVYRRIGVDLRQKGGAALDGRTIVPFRSKLIEAARAVGLFLRPSVLGLTPPSAHDPSLHVDLHGLPAVDARRPGPTDATLAVGL